MAAIFARHYARRYSICVAAICWVSLLFGTGTGARGVPAQTKPAKSDSPAVDCGQLNIPPGTILPVIPRDTVAASNAKDGQIIIRDGLSNVRIAHAGRTDPLGIITLDLLTRKTKIQDGAGLLLRVIG